MGLARWLAALALAVAPAAWGQTSISIDTSTTTGGGIRPGFMSTCNSATRGALRTNAGAVEVCNGSAWTAVGSGSGGGGAFTCPAGFIQVTRSCGQT